MVDVASQALEWLTESFSGGEVEDFDAATVLAYGQVRSVRAQRSARGIPSFGPP
jgi:hypothetical protein